MLYIFYHNLKEKKNFGYYCRSEAVFIVESLNEYLHYDCPGVQMLVKQTVPLFLELCHQ